MWIFTCTHKLIQVHEHPNTGLAPTENAPSLCPACSIQSLAVNTIKENDEKELAAFKIQYTTIANEISRARTKKGMKYRENIVEMESNLEDLLDSYKLKLLATSDAKKNLLTKDLRAGLIKKCVEVQDHIVMLLDLETLNLRRIKRNVEYEVCEFNEMDAGKFHFCHSTEREIVAADQVLIHQRTMIREGLKEARDGLKLWREAFEQKKEGPESFEGAIEEWWEWVLKALRDNV